MTVKKTCRIIVPLLLVLLAALTPDAVAQLAPDLDNLSEPVPVPLEMPDPKALDSFFARLLELEAGKGDRTLIMQIGDSHTAGESWTGEMRALFQSQFGDAGRGQALPGKIHKYYYPSQLKVGTEGDWEVTNTLYRNFEGPVGLPGFRATGKTPSDAIWVRTDANAATSNSFSLLRINFLKQPGGGGMNIIVDTDAPVRVETAGETGNGYYVAKLDDAPHNVEIRPAGNGPVSLFSVIMERDDPGIVFDAIGVGGTEFNLISRLDPDLFQNDMAQRDPALVILAFGTNEAWYKDEPPNYEHVVRTAINLVRAAVPDVPIIVVGPPDADRMMNACKSWVKKSGRKPEDLPCRNDPSALYVKKFRPSAAKCFWFPAPLLSPIREIQRKVSKETGAVFWNWSALMKGTCGAHRWANVNPPLAWSDHIHQTSRGYKVTARALYNAIIAEYNNYKKRLAQQQ